MEDKINAYKSELRKYKYYTNRLKYYKEKKMLAEHEESGLASKGNEERAQGSSDPLAKNLHRLQLVEDIEQCDIKIDRFQQKITSIDNSLEELDTEIGDIIKRVYCWRDTTLEQESYEIGYSIKTIKRKIDEEISKMSLSTLEDVLL